MHVCLLFQAEECIDRFEYEVAQKFCQRALEQEADNIRALETSGTLLLELGNTDGAKQVYNRPVKYVQIKQFDRIKANVRTTQDLE